DTNVYISALVFGGVPRSVLVLAELGRFELCTSAQIRREVERTLAEKFQWTQAEIVKACRPLWDIARHVEPRLFVAVAADPDDDRILECAAASKAHVIVTGDDDLLRLKSYEGIDILKPRAFLSRLS